MSNTKRLALILPMAALVAAIGLILFFLKDDIFKKENNSLTTPAISLMEAYKETNSPSADNPILTHENVYTKIYKPEDFGYDSDMMIRIDDNALKEAIYLTLETIGKPAIGPITADDMCNLRGLIITAYGENVNLLNYFPERDDYLAEECVFKTFDTINSLSGIQYAYNLKVLIISDLAIDNLDSLSMLENLEILILSENNGQLCNIDALSGLKNLRVLEVSGTQINDISVINNFDKLSHLIIQRNNLTEIEAIAELNNLKMLYLDTAVYNNNPEIINLLKEKGCEIITE